MNPKFLHIIPNCNHAVSLGNLLASIQNTSDHEILIESSHYHSLDYFQKTKNVFRNTSRLNNNLNLNKGVTVVIHGIFSQAIFALTAKLIDSSVKTVWSIWGGDAKLLSNQKNLEILNGLDFIICVPGETLPYPELKVPEVHGCLYIPPASIDNQVEKDDMVVVGNSGDQSNDHPKLLQILKDTQFDKIYLPLSYNCSADYLDKLIKITKDLGLYEKTIFQTEMLDIDEYCRVFQKAKVFLTAHNRQQSLGSMQIAYLNDCLVFMKKNIIFDNGSSMLNPGYLTMLSMGYSGIYDVEELICKKVDLPVPVKNKNIVNSFNIRSKRYVERMFNTIAGF